MMSRDIFQLSYSFHGYERETTGFKLEGGPKISRFAALNLKKSRPATGMKKMESLLMNWSLKQNFLYQKSRDSP